MKNNTFMIIVKTIAITFGVMAVLIIIGAYFSTNNDTTKEFQKEDDLRIGAFTAATMFVKQGLKSPSTAEFPAYKDYMVWKESHNTYSVKSYVDSQNSFGAMIRTDFYFLLKDSVNTWFVIDYKINGR